jgi:hypothetical protein
MTTTEFSCSLRHLLAIAAAFGNGVSAADRPKSHYAEIKVVDAETGHGVPLVELETVNALRFVTDNAGRIAFHEPELMDQQLFFYVRSHGYEYPKDFFKFAGVRLTPRAGEITEIKLPRKNLAERLCRLTGEGRYRDTILLGYDPPLKESEHPGRVMGQDSIQSAVYRDKVYWFWGDTQRREYPLGIFRTCGATTEVPAKWGSTFDLRHGIPYDYFVDPKTGFVRNMIPLPERPEGVVWMFGICTVPDENGVERLVGHYSRRKGLVDELEHGIAVFNDDKAIFEPAASLPLSDTWRWPNTNPIRYADSNHQWLLFNSPTPNVRVRARLQDVLNPAKYEAFTCAKSDGDRLEPDFGPDGTLRWRWQTELPPYDAKLEQDWLKQGKLRPEQTRFHPVNVQDPTERVTLHSGSVRWNAFRRRWILIAGQSGGKPSRLGEVWYAEAKDPTGPFQKAIRIVTHDRMTFYNVCHHAILDEDDGRLIHFEGTYTNDFSGNPDKTARYNYNQVLYRLDLGAAALREAFIE